MVAVDAARASGPKRLRHQPEGEEEKRRVVNLSGKEKLDYTACAVSGDYIRYDSYLTTRSVIMKRAENISPGVLWVDTQVKPSK